MRRVRPHWFFMKKRQSQQINPVGTPQRRVAAKTSRSKAAADRGDDSKASEGNRDEQVACKLIGDLEYRHGVDTTTLDLVLRGGRGSVRGLVTDQEELEAVRDSIMEEGGITDLEVTLRIAPTQREEERDTARSVQLALEGVSELEGADIQVACLQVGAAPRTLVLRGTVKRVLQKQLAGMIAIRMVEGARLRNRLLLVS